MDNFKKINILRTTNSNKCVASIFLLHYFLILQVLPNECVGVHVSRTPAKDFNKNDIIHPIVYHGTTRRTLSTTRDINGTHHSNVTMIVPVGGDEIVLDLRLNEDLVAGDHTLQYQEKGHTVNHKPNKEELDLCHYSGSVRGKPNSWAAVSTCNGVSGVIFDGQRMRYIQPAEGSEIQSQHYLYDHNDLKMEYHCGFKGDVTYDTVHLERHQGQRQINNSRASRYKRETEKTENVRRPYNVEEPYNANEKSRYVELVLVADYREFRANGGSIRRVHSNMIQVANIMNSMYSPLNIYIALVGVVIWSERDEIQFEENGDTTLANFLHYRKNKLVTQIPNDNAQLLTRQSFSDGIVGKALKSQICTLMGSGGVVSNFSPVTAVVAFAIAHELGHNIGMEHDTGEDCECPDEKCIMGPSSTSVVPVHWSSCSLKSLALLFERGMDYCLRNKPKRLFESPTCGNGFIEPGEQCDCGIVPGGGANPCHACCHPDTCMLRSNATCGAGTCCDLTTCSFKRAGTVCRARRNVCDLPEYCSGHKSYCPKDVYKMDATRCYVGDQAYCVRGSCRSHNSQCRLLWGSTGESSHLKCYTTTNIKGTKSGNCGYDAINKVYKSCSVRDAFCGRLQCSHLNVPLQFGMESTSELHSAFVVENNTLNLCHAAHIDLGVSDVDPGLVPDGAKCGKNRMCLNQRCVSVAAVRAAVAKSKSSVCPSDCLGYCNSEGHCHCFPGFAPPLCTTPGDGGSVDSGPTRPPYNSKLAMYIIFLGIIPSIILILFIVYYSRHNVLLWWKKLHKSTATTQEPQN